MVNVKSVETLLTFMSMITKATVELTTMLNRINMVKLETKLYINVHATSRELSVILSDLIQILVKLPLYVLTQSCPDVSGVVACGRKDGRPTERPNVR